MPFRLLKNFTLKGNMTAVQVLNRFPKKLSNQQTVLQQS